MTDFLKKAGNLLFACKRLVFKIPNRPKETPDSLESAKPIETVLLSDLMKDGKVKNFLGTIPSFKKLPSDCKIAKHYADTIKLLAHDQLSGDEEKTARDRVSQYFEEKAKQYDVTHRGESADKTKEQKRMKEGVSYNKEYIETVPGMGRYLFFVPEGFDGSVDMYFPGDTYSIEMANSTMGLTRHARGNKSALIIVEGDASCLRDNQEKRYAKFNLNKLMSHFKGKTDLTCRNFNFMGHSRGGSALGKLLDKFQNKPEGVTFTFLDANYWGRDIPKIVKFVKNGGRLNVAFQSNPDYGPGNKAHHTKIQSIVSGELIPRLQAIPGLNLRRVGNTWESADGRVVIQNAGALTHAQVPQRYVDKYMDRDGAGGIGQTEIGTALTEAERAEGGRGATMVGQYASAGEVVVGKPSEDTEPYGEEHIEGFFKDVEGRRKDQKAMDEFSSWASQQTDVEVLRRGNVSAEENMKDPFEKHVRLASEYIASGVRVNGHVGFTVDFKGNETAEWKVGAGHILPPTVKAVRVYDESGNVLFDRAERKVVNGRVGYFTESGEYAYIHTGYQIAILEVQSVTNAETQARMKEENELFEAEEKKIVAKNYLAEYFREKGIAMEVDDIYFESVLGGFTNQMYPEWWEDYKKSKLENIKDAAQLQEKLKSEFTKVFDAEFTPENISFIKNLLRLRDAQAFDKLSLSDYVGLKKDPKFEPLKKEMTDDEIAAFRKGTLGGKDLSDFLVETKEVLSDEPFVKDVDDFGNTVVLRASAMSAFRRARAIAASKGIKLEIYSSYRTLEHQQRLWDKAAPDRRGTFVASPGGSPHHTGGAIDIRAYRSGKRDQSLLQQVLPEAGFVNYEAEDWHWEIYTARWKRMTRRSGAVYGKEMAFNAKTARSYDDYVEHQHKVSAPQVGVSQKREDDVSLNETSETDSAFTQFLCGEAEGMWRDPRRSDTRGRGNCQHNAGFLAERVLAKVGRGKSINCPRMPLDRNATERLRGKRVSSLRESDFNGLKPGIVFFVSKTEEYSSYKLRPGPDGKIPLVSDTGRHWFTYLGKDSSGHAILTDNHGARRSVNQMGSWVGNRTVLNIHDPYADLRSDMYAENGQVRLRA